jgi:hypothetical protein
MKYAVEMDSGAMIYIKPSSMKIDSGIQKLVGGVGGIRRQTDSMMIASA